MQQKRGSDAGSEQGERLRMLAFLWDELAARHSCGLFRQEFQADLEHLIRFQSEFPQTSPTVLVTLFEKKIIGMLRERFPGGEIHALRARLNRSN